MSEGIKILPDSETLYSVTYTCSTPGCVIRGVDKPHYEVVTLALEDIVEKLKCSVCGGDMIKSKVVESGGVDKEIWT